MGHCAGVALVAAVGVVFRLGLRRSVVTTAFAAVVLLTASYGVIYGVLVPAENARQTYRPMVAELELALAREERLAGKPVRLYDYLKQRPFVYYFLDRELLRLDTQRDLRRQVEAGEPFHMIVWIKGWINPASWRCEGCDPWPGGVKDPRKLFQVVKTFKAPDNPHDVELLLVRYAPVGAATRPVVMPHHDRREGRPLRDIAPPDRKSDRR